MWNFFNTKFLPQWKDWSSSYQVKQVIALFCNLNAVMLGYYSSKDLRVTEIVKEIMFERV